MKFLVLILVVLVVVMLAKAARGRLTRRTDDAPPAPPPAAQPEGEVMLACAHCGLHLPSSDALPGRGGVYCSEGHRAIAEARHEPP